ncbi:hypothetical protein HY629_01350, partial [Candidatus Uhrbacteria bacterium]|nr:hypothetical protein [Candidatus Uhrbacteria bacterium]
AYIKLSNFNEDTTEKMTALLRELLLTSPKGLILDLRNNPGGYLETSVEVANFWVEKGALVVKEQLSDNSGKEHTAARDPLVQDLKTIVLVNEGSASASEIVAGALQDYVKARVVGRKTFGKGSVQELINLRGGAAVKITIAKWFTPNGRSINDEGVKPDVEITDAMIERAEKMGYDSYLAEAFALLGQPLKIAKVKTQKSK